VGDALIAHELAHVVQQGGAAPASPAAAAPAGDYGALERDADDAAVGAVASLWGGVRAGLAGLGAGAGAALKSGLRLQRCGASQRPAVRAPAPTAAPAGTSGHLACPATTQQAQGATAGTSAAPSRLDARGQAIVAMAQNTAQPIEQRAVQAVTAIICQYFPGDAEKVSGVVYAAEEPGLRVTTVRDGTTIRGQVTVGRYFVENTTEGGLARRVLQVQHELQHIDQWRAGMTGQANQPEREFLAFHREALSPEFPGTGRVSHATRVGLIDAALGYYHCLNADKQAQYRAQQDELLQRRPVEESASGRPHTDPPAACRTQ
jgi:hypothetical protein